MKTSTTATTATTSPIHNQPPMGQHRPPPIPPPTNAVASSSTAASRTSLRQSMSQKHLSVAEQAFLRDICENGHESQVQAAHDKLLDTEVFFSIEGEKESIPLNQDDDDDDDTPRDPLRTQSDGALLLRQSNLTESLTAASEFRHSTGHNGSERRLNRLNERRASMAVHLWKAHENGLGISKQASRRSLLVRSSSAIVGRRRRSSSTSSSSANEMTLDPDIFRPSVKATTSTVNQHQMPVERRRRTSWHSESISGLPPPTQPPMPKMQPVGGRMRSESAGNRKSVTFHKDALKPQIRSSINSNVVPPMLLPRRSSSASSIPSLHPGAPISSPSSASISSVPSIRLAHSIRSNSMASLMSDITETDGYSKDDDEKKSIDDGDQRDHEKASSSPWKSSFGTQQQPPTVQDAVKLLHTNDPTAPLQLNGVTVVPSTSSDRLDVPQRRVMTRSASINVYQGEGVEVMTDVLSADDSELYMPAMADSLTLKNSSSFDDFALQINSNRASSDGKGIFRRLIRRSYSEDSTGLFRGKPLMGDNSNSMVDESWNTSKVEDDDFNDDEDEDYYDSWKVVEDEYENGYGGGGTLPFRILGTSADDVDAHPHVLSPPLLESLQAFVPLEKSSDNFWMKYSMVRDGNTLYSFLQHARGSKHTILAIETVDGEVFGAFTAEPWRKSWNYFGNGESFLWRMRHSRHEKCHSIIDQAHMESEIDVYPFIGMNNCIQFCSSDKIAVGGGTYVTSPTFSDHSDLISDNVTKIQDRYKAHEWGFGLTIENDFLHGTSSPCLTFGSPSLSTIHSDGSLFEIMNIELWTLTPCNRLEDAEKLELGKLFLESHTRMQ